MKIESLELINFRAFHGSHKIIFSTDKKKSVNVIVAQNNVGKSSILESIFWCLYGEMPIGADKIDDKINNQSEALDEAAKAQVKLNIIDETAEGEDKYTISRVLPSENSDSVFSALKYNYEDKSYDEIDARTLVNRLLPTNLRDFFLFRGEGVEDLFVKNEERLKSSLEHIQGLTWLEESRKDLELFLSSLLQKKQKLSKNKQKEDDLSENLTDLHEAKDNLQRRLQKNIEDIGECENSIKQYNELINDSGVDEVAKRNKDNERLKTKIKIEINPAIEKLIKEKFSLISERGFRVFGYSYKEKIDKFLDIQRSKGKFPADYSEAFLKNILDSGKCVCGDEINKEKREVLEKNLNDGLTNEQDRITREIGVELGAFETANKEHQRNIHRINNELKKLNNLKKQYEIDVKENEQFLKDYKNIGTKDIKKWQTNKASEEEHLRKLLVEKGSLYNKYEAAKETFEKAKNDAEKFGRASRDHTLDFKIQYINDCIDLLNENINDSRELIRKELLKTLQKLTSRYSTLGETFIYKNDESFNPLLVEKGSKVERVLNKGDLTMKGIYFACAAIMQNTNRKKDSERLISEGTNAPMVVDAPFSNLDQNNLNNAAKMIIDCSEQSIILVNYKDYSNFIDVVKKSGKLGSHFYLQRSVKEKETGTDVNLKMNIDGKEIDSHIMGQNLTTTHIHEVKVKNG